MIRRVKRIFYGILNKRIIKSYKGHLFINNFTILSKVTHLGYNCHFNGMRIRGGGDVFIGNNFHSGSGCKIITSFHNYDSDDCIPYGNEIIHKKVIIGDNVWIGDDVLILGGVSIADGAIIQAGSTVVSDIGYCEIAGGSPAKVFKMRDIKHYEKLQSLGKYQ